MIKRSTEMNWDSSQDWIDYMGSCRFEGSFWWCRWPGSNVVHSVSAGQRLRPRLRVKA